MPVAPIAYLATVDYDDPFSDKKTTPGETGYHMLNRLGLVNYHTLNGTQTNADWRKYTPPYCFVVSKGPDRDKDGWASAGMNYFKKFTDYHDPELVNLQYDPTNGTMSHGDIIRMGP